MVDGFNNEKNGFYIPHNLNVDPLKLLNDYFLILKMPAKVVFAGIEN